MMTIRPDEMTAPDEELAVTIARRTASAEGGRLARRAGEELYRRHARKLLAFLTTRVHRSDLDDFHQGIWERVWERLPEGFHGGNFRAWLYQIARNYLIDQGRKRRPQPLESEEEWSDDRQAAPDAPLLERERQQALSRCLERLGAEAAGLVRARLAGESYPEICLRLGLKMERAHKLFHQAKEQLQLCVERALAS